MSNMKTNYEVSNLNLYLDWRQQFNSKFDQMTKHKESKVYISDCKQFKLEVFIYSIDINKEGWDYSRGVVTRLLDNLIVADIKRNYSCFPFIWFNNYLICGEDYQGYSVVDLQQQTTTVYFPDEGFKGFGLCFSNLHKYLPKNLLIAEACYWGGPYDLYIFDFNDPTSLPLTLLKEFDVEFNIINIKDGILQFSESIEYRISDNKKYYDLSDTEQDELGLSRGSSEYKNELVFEFDLNSLKLLKKN